MASIGDWRVHVVGEDIFASEVRCDADDYRYAGRVGESVEISAGEIPTQIADRCRAVTASLGLSVAGIDLRRTPDDQTRLYMNVGQEMGVGPGDVVGAILGETGLAGKVVGAIDLRERHLFVDVASEHVNSIVAKLNRTQIKGRKLKVKVA